MDTIKNNLAIKNDFTWFFDRAIKWVHDSLLVLGMISVYLFTSGFLPQDISKEIKDKYEVVIQANKSTKTP